MGCATVQQEGIGGVEKGGKGFQHRQLLYTNIFKCKVHNSWNADMKALVWERKEEAGQNNILEILIVWDMVVVDVEWHKAGKLGIRSWSVTTVSPDGTEHVMVTWTFYFLLLNL